MTYLMSFLFAGTVCLLAQLIYEFTKLTQGHIVTLFVIIGASLSFFNIYDKIIEIFHSGATSLIMNYGHMLYQSAKIGAKTNDYFQIFIEIMKSTSGLVSYAIILALIISFIKRPRP